VRLGVLVAPLRSSHEPGQPRTGRVGGHPGQAWAHTLVSGHPSPPGRVRLHAACRAGRQLPGCHHGQGGSGQTRPGGPAPSSGTVAILTGGSLQPSQAWLRRPVRGFRSRHLISDRRADNQRDAGRRRSRRGQLRPEPPSGKPPGMGHNRGRALEPVRLPGCAMRLRRQLLKEAQDRGGGRVDQMPALNDERAAVGQGGGHRVGELPEDLRRGGRDQQRWLVNGDRGRLIDRQGPPVTSARMAGPLSANICLTGAGNPSHAHPRGPRG